MKFCHHKCNILRSCRRKQAYPRQLECTLDSRSKFASVSDYVLVVIMEVWSVEILLHRLFLVSEESAVEM
jgi:hypothetical protein